VQTRIARKSRGGFSEAVNAAVHPSPAYRWLCFDADGVLLDYDRAEHRALAEALGALGHEPTPELRALYREVNRELWQAWEQGRISVEHLKTLRFERFLQRAGISAPAALFADRYLEALARGYDLWPGCSEVLSLLRQRHHLAVVTNGLSRVQRRRLQGAGLLSLFDVVIISEEIGAAKPAKAFFEIAREQMGRPAPETILIVGDSWEADIAGAVASGWDACWFNPDGRPTPPAPTVQRVVRSWAELRQWLVDGDQVG
jgi:YjjG family noncanonical pyrimidine nucleotidase